MHNGKSTERPASDGPDKVARRVGTQDERAGTVLRGSTYRAASEEDESCDGGRDAANEPRAVGFQMRVHLAALIVMVVSALCLQAGRAQAAEPTAVGLWEQVDVSTGKPDGWFLISEHNGIYSGTLVKIFVKPGENPNPVCTQCSGAQKDAPWLGLTIIKGMEREGLDYENGTILDPRDGSEYYARMRLSPDGQMLTVRGYLGIDPLGGGEVWSRLPGSALSGSLVK
jgi:uncharacterized protein (DUF2147 family)